MKPKDCRCENSNVGIFFDEGQECWVAECQSCFRSGPCAQSTIGAVVSWNEMIGDECSDD